MIILSVLPTCVFWVILKETLWNIRHLRKYSRVTRQLLEERIKHPSLLFPNRLSSTIFGCCEHIEEAVMNINNAMNCFFLIKITPEFIGLFIFIIHLIIRLVLSVRIERHLQAILQKKNIYSYPQYLEPIFH